ncbi:MAG: oligosaccharide flippase family protein [Bacteroidia bacterium]
MQFLDKFLGIFFKSEENRNKLVKVIIPSFAIQSVAILISFAINFILARGLGASKYGVFTFAFSVVFPLVNLVSFGLGILMVREMPHIITRKSPGLLKGLHNWSVKLVIPLCIILAALVAAIVYLLPEREYTIPILIASAVIPFYGLMNYYSASLKGLHKIVLSQISDNLIRPGVFLIIMSLFYFFNRNNFGVYSAIYTNIIAFAIGLVFASAMFYKKAEFKGIKPEYDTKKWWKGLGSLTLLNGILSLDSRLDLLLLGFITNSTQVGIFNISHKIALTLYFFLSVMNTIIAPTISRLNSLNDKAGMQRMITKTVRWVMVFSLPAGIIIIIFSKWIMLYFGKEFIDGQLALIILCVTQLFSISCGPVGVISMMTGHEKYNTIATLMSMAITIILNIILTPHIGLTGTAIAASAGIIIWNIYMIIKVKKNVGIYSWVYIK